MLVPALVTGLQTAKIGLGPVDAIFEGLPLHSLGMDWIPFLVVGFIVGLIYKAAVPDKDAQTEEA